MANPNISEIITTTYKNRDKSVADNALDNVALLRHMKDNNKIRKVSGGHKLNQPLAYAENGTVSWYSGYEILDNSPQDVLTSAEYEWKQLIGAVGMSGLDQIKNDGKEAFLDLLEQRIENLDTTLMNKLEEGLFADGTGNDGKEIGGLQSIVADAGTGTVGGIDSSTYTFWRNVTYDATTDGGGVASASNIQGYMNAVYMQLVRGADSPDLLIGDNNYWGFYHDSLTEIQRITGRDTKLGSQGFKTIEYKGVPFVLGGGKGGACPSNHIYFLNTKYLFLKVKNDRFFDPIGSDREPTNQDAFVKYIGFAGNMTCSNRSLQGVLKD